MNTLSRLRNLEKETRQTITAMPITYDITKDALYKEGFEKGFAEGFEKGFAEGLKKGAAIAAEKHQKILEQIIINLLNKRSYSTSKIASICKVPQSLVKKIKKTIEE